MQLEPKKGGADLLSNWKIRLNFSQSSGAWFEIISGAGDGGGLAFLHSFSLIYFCVFLLLLIFSIYYSADLTMCGVMVNIALQLSHCQHSSD